ncbi:MAG: hypothetical protein AAGF31_03510 [Planctomycetota bacterium]
MPRLTIIFAIAGVLLIPMVAAAAQYPLLDPVTTYTNGMPLASTTPMRSHNVYYRCDPDRVGCCGGRYNRPCINSLVCPDSCCVRSPMPATSRLTDTMMVESTELDPAQFERLGTIPNELQAIAGGANRLPGGIRP